MLVSVPQRSFRHQCTHFVVGSLSDYFAIQNARSEAMVDRATVTPKFARHLLNTVSRNV
jgi:hypothetical protein